MDPGEMLELIREAIKTSKRFDAIESVDQASDHRLYVYPFSGRRLVVEVSYTQGND